jgi:hypothetical protein
MRFVFQIPVKGIVDYKSDNDFKAKNHEDAIAVKLTAEGQENSYVIRFQR